MISYKTATLLKQLWGGDSKWGRGIGGQTFCFLYKEFGVGASGLMENNLLEYVDNCLEQCGLLEYGNIYTPSNSPPPPEWTNVGRDKWSVIFLFLFPLSSYLFHLFSFLLPFASRILSFVPYLSCSP